ncbi:MAG: 16S rRNA (cytosine(1402)-N(4))-methyltransferase RsmH [Chloroflexi bacterium]|nr:16S rRNA (cytosine(1402)-N(4))-methyltransferase RsmH [Chloroflexota bacterium]
MIHVSVLLKETVEALEVHMNGKYIDCTVGAGGHAEEILRRGGWLLGIDADVNAIAIADKRLNAYEKVKLVNGNFSQLKDISDRYGFSEVDGILFDLGMSSMELESGARGFSFQKDEPLDMRYSLKQKVTASDLVNNLSERELINVLEKYGEEPQSKLIARHIIQNRPIKTSGQLAVVIEKAIGRRGKIHPATRSFQALRIAVNKELDSLESGLNQAIGLLKSGGRLAVISFHSLEDRLTKTIFRHESSGCICSKEMPVCTCNHKPALKLINKKAIKASREEIKANPRSRSARLRIVERI